jgi:hypothetical protein
MMIITRHAHNARSNESDHLLLRELEEEQWVPQLRFKVSLCHADRLGIECQKMEWNVATCTDKKVDSHL